MGSGNPITYKVLKVSYQNRFEWYGFGSLNIIKIKIK